MTVDRDLLYQHSKNPYEASLVVSDTTQHFVALARLVAAGFTVDADGQRLKVAPAALLTPAQRDWIRTHKARLVAAVSTPHWRWCVEYPDGQRCVVDCLPDADWRDVARDYAGAVVWPAHEGLNAAAWLGAGNGAETG